MDKVDGRIMRLIIDVPFPLAASRRFTNFLTFLRKNGSQHFDSWQRARLQISFQELRLV